MRQGKFRDEKLRPLRYVLANPRARGGGGLSALRKKAGQAGGPRGIFLSLGSLVCEEF